MGWCFLRVLCSRDGALLCDRDGRASAEAHHVRGQEPFVESRLGRKVYTVRISCQKTTSICSINWIIHFGWQNLRKATPSYFNRLFLPTEMSHPIHRKCSSNFTTGRNRRNVSKITSAFELDNFRIKYCVLDVSKKLFVVQENSPVQCYTLSTMQSWW